MEQMSRGRPDFTLLFLAVLLVGFGLVMVFSASSAVALHKWDQAWFYARKQMMFAAAGFFMMFLFMNIRFTAWKALTFLLILVSFGSLILVLIFGEPINDARRWIYIGSFSIQPSEFVKLFIVLYISAMISKKGEKIKDFKTGLLPILIVLGVICVLIYLQPDYGSMLLLMAIAVIMLIHGGARLVHLLGILTAVIPILVYLAISESYRLSRLTSYLNPWDDPGVSGFQLIQSLFALAHGGWSGVGLGQSIQKLHYLPESFTDFIFAVIGEELGFIGTLLFLCVYFAFILRGLFVAMRCSDVYGQLLGTGIVSMFGLQFLLNIGAVTGSLPITGVTLPFISYGGSSLLVCMTSVGILLSISRDSNRMRLDRDKKEEIRTVRGLP